MTSPFDDPFAELFGQAPVGQAQPMMYRQGTIVTFNPNTLENTVLVSGSTFTNLPLLGVAEAATLVAGSVVGLIAVADTWAIIGRFVVPNTPGAIQAITLLNQSIFAHSITTAETTASTTYTDLATVGPTVTVNVGPSGRLVILQAALFGGGAAAGVSPVYEARASVDVSGANTISASDATIFAQRRFQNIAIGGGTGATVSWVDQLSMSTITVLSGLNTGNTTITMKYRSPNATTLTFQNRSLVVIRL